MNASKQEDSKTPKFFIFDRIDELENITLELMDKTSSVEPTLKSTSESANDAVKLAQLTFILQFSLFIRQNPDRAKRILDHWSGLLKALDVNEQIYKNLRSFMTELYGRQEKHIKQVTEHKKRSDAKEVS